MRRQELHPRTIIVNKTQKLQSKQAKKNALIWLATKFPQAFDTSLSIQPLKIGIIDDILQYSTEAAQEGFSRSKLREALVLFTRRIDYLTCLKAREMRIDLWGNLIEPVTDEEAENAALKIKKRIEKSAKNARKLSALAKDTQVDSSRPRVNRAVSAPFHPVPSEANYFDNLPAEPVKAMPIIKHKTTRAFDPKAVARLKEKLGLTRKVDTED